ncbi:MAG: flagellar hook assembly protein FlgD [Phenylobacterium sp.]|uniref:flagellar hook assembly protein FlgD n=1 Tax=Phenylobacterium sp. TaxID=1871053 RepID=UPI001A5DE409|nr:flagellar hook assembly protein FlgD [Phenylobacterium sp.]MBL8556065.1 flagellar hook assembly protein FlgD [Phenylobacterium sp.]
MVDAVSAAAATTDSGALGRARLAENFDTFLSLLTTQLKNQDPLSPLDSNQFTQQIVQMTGVEQQLLTNDLLKKLVSNTGSGVSTAVALIGKEVRADSDVAALKGGKAEWTYILDRDASDVKLEVLDDKGRVVSSVAPTDNKAGEHAFTWDGKSAAGTPLAEGTYTLRVTARDSQGSSVTSNVVADGLVTGVQQKDGVTLLTINGAQVPWDTIVSIRQPPEPVTTASNGASGSSGSNTTPDNEDDETSSPAAA